ncbi:MAG: hypothetical protein L6R00_01265 [Phycisphaerae bacterium]|nr:hypothetical protein [Phycisphaerae bacterium]
MLAAVLLFGLVLFIAVGWTRSVRVRLKRESAVRLLAALNQALDAYHRDQGAFPPESDDASADAAVSLLLLHHQARDLLVDVPAGYWSAATPRRLVDPWGAPLRYIGSQREPARVATNGGRPFFASAGPDGAFGDRRPTALADDLAGDDPAILESAPTPRR